MHTELNLLGKLVTVPSTGPLLPTENIIFLHQGLSDMSLKLKIKPSQQKKKPGLKADYRTVQGPEDEVLQIKSERPGKDALFSQRMGLVWGSARTKLIPARPWCPLSILSGGKCNPRLTGPLLCSMVCLILRHLPPFISSLQAGGITKRKLLFKT